MDPRKCAKFEDCYKVSMILDKDLLDFQYAQAIEGVCANCKEGVEKQEAQVAMPVKEVK